MGYLKGENPKPGVKTWHFWNPNPRTKTQVKPETRQSKPKNPRVFQVSKFSVKLQNITVKIRTKIKNVKKILRKIFFKILRNFFLIFSAFKGEKWILKSFLEFFLLKKAKILAFIWILGTFSTKLWKPEYQKTEKTWVFLPKPDKNRKL